MFINPHSHSFKPKNSFGGGIHCPTVFTLHLCNREKDTSRLGPDYQNTPRVWSQKLSSSISHSPIYGEQLRLNLAFILYTWKLTNVGNNMRGIRSNDKYSVGSSWVNMAEQLSTQEIADHWEQEGIFLHIFRRLIIIMLYWEKLFQ